MELSKDQKITLLRAMLYSRHGDLREQRLIRQGKGWFHVAGMGHEAMAAAALHMEAGDYAFPFYRDRGFCVARGFSVFDLALAFYAKRESSSGGRQLPAHYSSRKLNVWSHLSPITAHWLPATGAAWGIQMDGKPNIVFASCGDGGSRQGDFYEAICFAKEKNLPIVYVVEDNGVAISTRTQGMHAKAIKTLHLEDWVEIDGTDVSEVSRAFKQAADKARNGGGPGFIWAKVERLASHSSADDHRNYRSEDELNEINERDPIVRVKRQLVKDGVLTESEIEAIDQEIEADVREQYSEAEKREDPKPGDEKKNVFGALGVGTPAELPEGTDCRMADAINMSFKHALETNKDACFFGEDIEDPLGGVFKLTKGLSTEYPGRVVNSPLAESTIIGIASGLASYGKRPIFEIQFIDFIMPGWNQLVNNLGNLRWRSNGEWTCPAIIYAPCGGYLPGGALWHSQSNEGAFAHFPGLLVVMPSTPEDAAGLLASALACEDPVLFLIPKHMLWAPKRLPESVKPVALGKAAVRHEGADITLVSWGNCLEVSEEALSKLNGEASVELIDLRSIVPWDKEAVVESVQKTGRLVIVQEDTKNCSVGQMIITTLMEEHSVWNAMVAPPVLVTKGNMHMAFNPKLEYSCLPDVDGVLKAVRELVAISKPQKLAQVPVSNIAALTQQPEKIDLHESAEGPLKTVILPNLGEGLREARVIEIFKKVGDSVSVDDPLCEVETDKAVFPVESSIEGVVEEWLVQEEDMIQVGQEIVKIKATGESVEEVRAANAETEHITDTEGALSAEIIRQLEGVLPASLSVTASWKALREVRGRTRGRSEGGAFSYTTMVAWAIVRALEESPAFRRLLKNGKISEPQEEFDMGFAVALDNDELETAVIPKANTLSWSEFVASYREALKKVHDGIPQSKARTSLLLTSLGPLKIRSGNPIVVPPAVATICLGEPHYEMRTPGNIDDLEEVVNLDLSFDHRWANGAGAGRFLRKVKENIEAFDSMDLG